MAVGSETVISIILSPHSKQFSLLFRGLQVCFSLCNASNSGGFPEAAIINCFGGLKQESFGVCFVWGGWCETLCVISVKILYCSVVGHIITSGSFRNFVLENLLLSGSVRLYF